MTGEDHFNASQNPYLYFQVLILTAQFEAVSNSRHTDTRMHTHNMPFSDALSLPLRLLNSFTALSDSDHTQSILLLP